jgi:hypothetical protein
VPSSIAPPIASGAPSAGAPADSLAGMASSGSAVVPSWPPPQQQQMQQMQIQQAYPGAMNYSQPYGPMHPLAQMQMQMPFASQLAMSAASPLAPANAHTQPIQGVAPHAFGTQPFNPAPPIASGAPSAGAPADSLAGMASSGSAVVPSWPPPQQQQQQQQQQQMQQMQIQQAYPGAMNYSQPYGPMHPLAQMQMQMMMLQAMPQFLAVAPKRKRRGESEGRTAALHHQPAHAMSSLVALIIMFRDAYPDVLLSHVLCSSNC